MQGFIPLSFNASLNQSASCPRSASNLWQAAQKRGGPRVVTDLARSHEEADRAAISTKLPKWRALPADQQWWPADVGFRLCSGGEEVLRAALIELQHLMGQPEGIRRLCPIEIYGFGPAAERRFFF